MASQVIGSDGLVYCFNSVVRRYMCHMYNPFGNLLLGSPAGPHSLVDQLVPWHQKPLQRLKPHGKVTFNFYSASSSSNNVISHIVSMCAIKDEMTLCALCSRSVFIDYIMCLIL